MNVYQEIEKCLQGHNTVNVVISGITCSGKTTLANAIWKIFSDKYSVAMVSQDDYFKNLSDIPRTREGYLTDSLDAFHGNEFFIDTPMEICLERRIARDTSKYGVPEARIRQYWNDCVKPMCERIIIPPKNLADMIIRYKDGKRL